MNISLHVCQVNIGSKTTQIVCGAPNVRKGLKVIVALPGAELPEKSIKAGVIRGQESNGMLCALSEIGIDNKFLKVEDKDGIHELPQDAPVGGAYFDSSFLGSAICFNIISSNI